jgi:hypothetical protein
LKYDHHDKVNGPEKRPVALDIFCQSLPMHTEADLVKYRGADDRRATRGELSTPSKMNRGSTVVSRVYLGKTREEQALVYCTHGHKVERKLLNR